MTYTCHSLTDITLLHFSGLELKVWGQVYSKYNARKTDLNKLDFSFHLLAHFQVEARLEWRLRGRKLSAALINVIECCSLIKYSIAVIYVARKLFMKRVLRRKELRDDVFCRFTHDIIQKMQELLLCML